MNTRNIKPLALWNNGQTFHATKLQLVNFFGYTFTEGDSTLTYRLITDEEVEDINGNTQVVQRIFVEGALALPYSVVSIWGEDDEPIWQFAFTQLNLEEEQS